MEAIEVVTERVVLNDFVDQRGDLACIEAAARDPEIVRVTTVPPHYSEDEGRAFIHRQRDRRVELAGWSLAIRDADTLRAVGQIGLWVSALAQGRADIGYWVVPGERGRGYASAALDAITVWAFAHLDLARITLSIDAENAASVATARSAGFEREALLRNWQVIDGVPRDLLIFGCFRPMREGHAEVSAVRRFDLGDRRAVVDLWRTAGLIRPQNDPDRDIDRKLAAADEGFFVATDAAGNVVGTVMAGYDGHRGWVNYLAVVPHARNAGIGRRLMDAAAEHLRLRGCVKINLQVRTGNADAVAFYESLGYTTDGVTSLGLRLEIDVVEADDVERATTH